jgi:hypothetical protein
MHKHAATGILQSSVWHSMQLRIDHPDNSKIGLHIGRITQGWGDVDRLGSQSREMGKKICHCLFSVSNTNSEPHSRGARSNNKIKCSTLIMAQRESPATAPLANLMHPTRSISMLSPPALPLPPQLLSSASISSLLLLARKPVLLPTQQGRFRVLKCSFAFLFLSKYAFCSSVVLGCCLRRLTRLPLFSWSLGCVHVSIPLPIVTKHFQEKSRLTPPTYHALRC